MTDRPSQDEADLAKPVLTIGESARLVRVGEESFREVVDRGDVPAVSLNQKHTVCLRDDLLEWLRQLGRKQAEERRLRHQGNRAKQDPPEAKRVPRPPRSSPRRQAPPDLRRYEITTGGRQD